MEIDVNQIKDYFIFSSSIFVRLTIVLSMMPVFNNKMVPSKIKIAIALAFSIFLFSNVHVANVKENYFILLLNDVMVGLIVSIVLNITFEIFILAGQIIAMQSGLGFATFVDPTTGSNTPIISQFYMYCVILIFFSLDGHLAFFEIILKSYIHGNFLMSNVEKNFFHEVIKFSSIMFSESIYLVMPAIVALLLANISLALLTRAVPQLNIFSVGFPITLTLGFIMVLVTISFIYSIFHRNLEFSLNFIRQVI